MRILNLVISFIVIGSIVGTAHSSSKPLASSNQKPFRIAITKIISHPSLNKIEAGIINQLKDAYPDIQITTTDAQGNITIAAQIAQKYAAQQNSIPYDLVIPITTPSTQTIVSAFRNSKTPILFSAVTDPVGANILPNLEDPQKNLTGVVDQPPVAKTLDLIQKTLKDVKTIGVIYNAGEANSEFQINVFRQAADLLNITVREVPVAKASDIQLATQSIIDQVDCIFLPNDNLVISSLESILKTATKYNKLVFVSDPESIGRGAFAAVTFDQYKIGLKVGDLAVQILSGGPFPRIHLMRNPEIFINTKHPKAIDLQATLDQAVSDRTSK